MPHLLPSSSFCPVEKEHNWIMFDGKRRKIAKSRIDEKSAKVLNLWTDVSDELAVWASPGEKSLLYDVADENCYYLFEYAQNKL